MKVVYTLAILISLSVTGGCSRTHQSNRPVSVLSSGSLDIPLVNVPTGATLTGHLDELLPVVFGLSTQPIKVWVKIDPSASWMEIEGLQKNSPTFVYHPDTQQLIFQNCETGWAYAVQG